MTVSKMVPKNGAKNGKVPKSRYLPAEWIYDFIEHNDLEEVLQQKYRDIGRIRHEFPNIIQLS